MFVLGIDPGSRSGWAVIDLKTGEVASSGTWRLAFESDDRPGQRFCRFRRCLHELCAELGRVVLIGYELRAGQGAGGAQAAHIHGGIVAHIEEIAEALGIAYVSVHPSTLKKWATGRGNAKKPEMMEAAKRRAGIDVRDDNEADAILVGLYTEEMQG